PSLLYAPATSDISPLSLHDALPIWLEGRAFDEVLAAADTAVQDAFARGGDGMFTVGDEEDEDIYHLSRRSFRLNGRIHELVLLRDRKSTRLNSSHVKISYAVFCLKK